MTIGDCRVLLIMMQVIPFRHRNVLLSHSIAVSMGGDGPMVKETSRHIQSASEFRVIMKVPELL